MYWEGKTVLVAGGCGFVGSHMVQMLVARGAKVRVIDNLARGRLDAVACVKDRIDFRQHDLAKLPIALEGCQGSDVVFNLAANASGIRFSMKNQPQMFYDNAVVNLNMLEGARRAGVRRFIFFSSSCVYSERAPVPTCESEGFIGGPESGNFGYGWAKRLGEAQAEVYRRHGDMKITSVRPVNVLGPGEHYDLEIGHVIPSLIMKAHRDDRLKVMGSGRQTRAFIHVSDLCDISLRLAEHGEEIREINVCSPEEITIGQLAKMVTDEMRKPRLEVEFDSTQPEGAKRKVADVTRLVEFLGRYEFTPIRNGIREMIEEYRALQAAGKA